MIFFLNCGRLEPDRTAECPRLLLISGLACPLQRATKSLAQTLPPVIKTRPIRNMSTTPPGSGYSGSSRPATITRRDLISRLPQIYPQDLSEAIRQDEAASKSVLVVLDDDPTGTQTVHSVPVLAEWSVDALAKEVRTIPREKHGLHIRSIDSN